MQGGASRSASFPRGPSRKTWNSETQRTMGWAAGREWRVAWIINTQHFVVARCASLVSWRRAIQNQPVGETDLQQLQVFWAKRAPHTTQGASACLRAMSAACIRRAGMDAAKCPSSAFCVLPPQRYGTRGPTTATGRRLRKRRVCISHRWHFAAGVWTAHFRYVSGRQTWEERHNHPTL